LRTPWDPGKKCMEHFARNKEVNEELPSWLVHLLETRGMPSYMAIKKAFYGRLPSLLFLFLGCCRLLFCVFI
jgi:hypothetical protein